MFNYLGYIEMPRTRLMNDLEWWPTNPFFTIFGYRRKKILVYHENIVKIQVKYLD